MTRSENLPVGDEVFADGNMTPVVRRGDEVRRTRSPWWRASAAVLHHLEDVGFTGSPRLLGYDGETERLSFVAGESIDASLDGFLEDTQLDRIGRMIRAYHDAMMTFEMPGDLAWPVMVGAPPSDGTICHNDIAPWNTIVHGDLPIAFIDWDLVAPGTRAWDLAYAAWRFVPLYPDERYGTPRERRRRIGVLLDAHGLSSFDRRGFLDLVRQRIRSAYETVEVWGRQGVPGFSRLYEGRMHIGALDDLVWLDRSLPGSDV
ncbi:MAG TPA: aminoglycoside phosphotransferase family protein [Thermomicrobiales bacterium]|nr:aminoglycoside phosphotransferase family protein [Thermomicrobiales bacterium]